MNDSFMVDLWINFDSDPESEDVFERLIEFLTRVSNCISEARSWEGSRLKVMCLTGSVSTKSHASSISSGSHGQFSVAVL